MRLHIKQVLCVIVSRLYLESSGASSRQLKSLSPCPQSEGTSRFFSCFEKSQSVLVMVVVLFYSTGILPNVLDDVHDASLSEH